MHDFETLQSEAVNRFNGDDLGVSMNKEPLDFYPFLLLVGKIIGALPFLNLLIEFVDNNGNEKIHDKESGEEDEENENNCNSAIVFAHGYVIELYTINCVIHHSRPHFQRRNFEEGHH